MRCQQAVNSSMFRRRASLRGAAGLCLPAAFALLLCIAGCGYMIGSAYQTEIRTIHVPIFLSDTERRGIEFQLTEAVHQEIQNRTHYRLARPPYAETQLTGRIVDFRKDLLGQSPFNDPRELQLSLAVEVTWEDLRDGRVLAQHQIPIPPDVVHLTSMAEFAPEVGQSRATATHEAVHRLARQVVDAMETPW